MTRGAAAPVIPEALLDQALLLDNQLCFLVYRLHRALTDRYRPILGELGLTYPQYLVMLALWERDPVRVSDLGDRLHLDSGTLSPLLKRLEASGFVTRTRSAADERSVEIRLTDEGRALRERAKAVPVWIGSCIAGTEEDYLRTRAVLTDALARVEDAGVVAPPLPAHATGTGRS